MIPPPRVSVWTRLFFNLSFRHKDTQRMKSGCKSLHSSHLCPPVIQTASNHCQCGYCLIVLIRSACCPSHIYLARTASEDPPSVYEWKCFYSDLQLPQKIVAITTKTIHNQRSKAQMEKWYYYFGRTTCSMEAYFLYYCISRILRVASSRIAFLFSVKTDAMGTSCENKFCSHLFTIPLFFSSFFLIYHLYDFIKSMCLFCRAFWLNILLITSDTNLEPNTKSGNAQMKLICLARV